MNALDLGNGVYFPITKNPTTRDIYKKLLKATDNEGEVELDHPDWLFNFYDISSYRTHCYGSVTVDSTTTFVPLEKNDSLVIYTIEKKFLGVNYPPTEDR